LGIFEGFWNFGWLADCGVVLGKIGSFSENQAKGLEFEFSSKNLLKSKAINDFSLIHSIIALLLANQQSRQNGNHQTN
jgi:hypothetical protein